MAAFLQEGLKIWPAGKHSDFEMQVAVSRQAEVGDEIALVMEGAVGRRGPSRRGALVCLKPE